MKLSLSRLCEFLMNYGNPVSLAFQRLMKFAMVTVKDRNTGIQVVSRSEAAGMFGEVFHKRHYVLPEAPIQKGHTVIDLGANHGFFSLFAAQKGAKVLAYEPDSSLCELMKGNLDSNRLSHLVTLKNEAVSAKRGTADLHVTNDLGGGMNSINTEFVGNIKLNVAKKVEVNVVTLNDILSSVEGRIRLCKIDCEGAELDILKGLNKANRERIDSFAIEIHPEAYRSEEILELFQRWKGFHLSGIDSGNTTNAMLYAVSERALQSWYQGTFCWYPHPAIKKSA